MKIPRLFLLAYLLTGANFLNAEQQFNTDTINHDPFQKPKKVTVSKTLPTSGTNTVNHSNWSPELTMTLRAGKKSMVNVGGQIIRLGEKVDGYRLIQVHERSAVFIHQGKTTRLIIEE